MASQTTTPFSSGQLEPSLSLESASVGRVGLIVSDLQRSLDFYAGVIGLDVLTQMPRSAQLGVTADERVLLELEQKPDVRPLRGKRLGLYHTALLLPSRSALASFADHLRQHGIRAGSSDHLVGEAFYLEDPDGLTIEVYADRERELWPWRGKELDAAVLPLNMASLLATPHTIWNGAPRGTVMGHMHLHTGDLKKAEQLYRRGLGMNLRTRGIPGALFLAAGDYHHHVGLNTWAGSVPSASEEEARLSLWELCVPDKQLSALRQQALIFG
jgi:catechol 2,3-dioxygenase